MATPGKYVESRGQYRDDNELIEHMKYAYDVLRREWQECKALVEFATTMPQGPPALMLDHIRRTTDAAHDLANRIKQGEVETGLFEIVSASTISYEYVQAIRAFWEHAKKVQEGHIAAQPSVLARAWSTIVDGSAPGTPPHTPPSSYSFPV